MSDRASELHRQSIVIDGLGGTGYPIHIQKQGGVTATNITLSGAATQEHVSDVIPNFSQYFDLLAIYPDEALLVENVADIERAKSEGKVGLIFGFQGLTQIGRGLYWITILRKLGLRICGLVYNEANLIGASCADRQDPGLSFYGKQVVNELNRNGVVIDLSHTGDQTSLDAVRASARPVIVSHSNPRRLCDHPRNVPDDLMKAVADSGGVIGISQYGPLLDRGDGSLPTIETWLDHIDYAMGLVGIDHVGLGTDSFSGVYSWFWWARYMTRYRDLVPARYLQPELRGVNTHNVQGFESNADLPEVTAGLMARGHPDKDIQKILGLNFLRVFGEVWHKT